MNPNRCYEVRAKRLVDESELEEDDLSVPEVWDTMLPEGSEGWSDSERATYVLDDFHESVAIGMLEDFEIGVFDNEGVEIFEEFDREV